MTDTEFAVVAGFFIVVGAVLQGYGFWLAFGESSRFGKALTKYAGEVRVRPITAHERGDAYDALMVVSGPAPTIEERVGKLESDLATVREEVSARSIEAIREAEKTATSLASDARQVAEDEIKRLAEVLGKVPGQGRRPIAFFVAGLVFEAVGAIVALAPLL